MIGGGGHAGVVLNAMKLEGAYQPIGITDPDPIMQGRSILGVPVIGDDGQVEAKAAAGIRYFVIAIGSVDRNSHRKEVFDRISRLGLSPATVLHPDSIVAPSAEIGPGSVILAGAVVNPNSAIHENVIVNSLALVEHDSIISNHAHICPGALVGGGARVHEGAFVGAGAIIRQGITVGSWATIAMGAVVVRSVEAGTTVAGVPAQRLERVN